MPGRIVVAVVAELTLYGIGAREGCFAELLRILETKYELARIGGEDWLPNWRDKFGYETSWGEWWSPLLPNWRGKFGHAVCRAERWPPLLPN